MKQETLNKAKDLEDQITRLKRLIDTLYKEAIFKGFFFIQDTPKFDERIWLVYKEYLKKLEKELKNE